MAGEPFFSRHTAATHVYCLVPTSSDSTETWLTLLLLSGRKITAGLESGLALQNNCYSYQEKLVNVLSQLP